MSLKSLTPQPRYGVFFGFFKMAAAAILCFVHFKFLTVGRVKSVELCHCAKFCGDRSNGCTDMTIFRFFQDGSSPPCWICDACVTWDHHEGYLVVFITVQNVVEIGVVVLKICGFRYYPSLGWKCLFTPLFGWFLGYISPNNVTHGPNPKNDCPWAKPRQLSHKVQISVARFELGVGTKKRMNRTGQWKKSQRGYILLICGEAPIEAMYMKNCSAGDVLDLFTCEKFQNGIFRGYDLLIFEWVLQQSSAIALPVIFCQFYYPCNAMLVRYLLSLRVRPFVCLPITSGSFT